MVAARAALMAARRATGEARRTEGRMIVNGWWMWVLCCVYCHCVMSL